MAFPSHTAISKMLTQAAGVGQRYVVEAYNVKSQLEHLKMEITDGSNTLKAVILVRSQKHNLFKYGKPYGEEPRYLIQVTQFNLHIEKGKIFMEIMDFHPLEPPITKEIAEKEHNTIKRQPISETSTMLSTQKKAVVKKQAEQIGMMELQMDSKDSQIKDVQQEEIEEDKLKEFEKICDLYVDFQGKWEIVVRVLDKTYKEFQNKAGKTTKLFTLLLIDRTGMLIQGVMFGDDSKQLHDLIKTKSVYRIAKGQIKQQTYKKNRSNKYSKLSIIFSKNSSFTIVKDIKSIPYDIDESVSISEVMTEMNPDKQYDIAAVLLSIGQERTFQKEDGRTIYKRTIVIGDPQGKKSIEANIWNKNIKVEKSWTNQAILLKYFKLNHFKEAYSLSAAFKSEIILKPNHRYNSICRSFTEEDYQSINLVVKQIKQEKQTVLKDRATKMIRQLESEMSLIGPHQTVYSDVQVWLTNVSFKSKWYYSACNNPKCKKSAQSFTKCLACNFYNDQTNRRFILPVQLSDFTGSIWITAFDQFAGEIFNGTTIDELAKLNENELKEESEKKLYKQYRVRISSKKDFEGGIKHHIYGKVSQISTQKMIANNIEKIKAMLND